jgi:hypothetical protein
MSDQLTRVIVAGVLLLHGLGHAGALGALAWIGLRGGDAGPWLPAKSWLVASLPSSTATAIAATFWIVACVGFVAAAAGFWFELGEWWRAVAVVSALVSLVGIVLFFGTWPTFNTIAALAVDVAVLVAILWLDWPAHTA